MLYRALLFHVAPNQGGVVLKFITYLTLDR